MARKQALAEVVPVDDSGIVGVNEVRLVGRGLDSGFLNGLQVVPPVIDLDHHLDQGGDLGTFW